MPSPFPGMDPFIEPHKWRGFHTSFIVAMQEQLVPSIRPKYMAEIEERVYVVHDPEDGEARQIVPDVLISESYVSEPTPARYSAGTSKSEPFQIHLPILEKVKERYLTIRKTGSHDLVCVIELLSPTNKRSGSDDRALYVAKREEILQSDVHLIELDLLRGGKRLESREPLPPADFYALLSRSSDRPRALAYKWTLRDRLPTIPIPLTDGDPDVLLDLQEAFTCLYDRGGYDYSLDYSAPVEPRLSDEDALWVKNVLEHRK